MYLFRIHSNILHCKIPNLMYFHTKYTRMNISKFRKFSQFSKANCQNVNCVYGLCIILLFVEIVHFSQNIRSSFFRGFAFGFSQSLIFFAMAGIFRYGAQLVVDGDLEYESMFKYVLRPFWHKNGRNIEICRQ